MLQVIETRSSSSNKVYTTTYDPVTGDTSCDCPGWRFKRGDGPRTCKHTQAVLVTPAAAVRPATVAPAVAGPTVKPMLASAMVTPLTGAAFNAHFRAPEWVLEQKLDGHRLVVVVCRGAVAATARGGNARALPSAMVEALLHLSDGTYDGELCANGGISSDVTRIGAELVLVLFDALEILGMDLRARPYSHRRAALLAELHRLPEGQRSVSTVEAVPPSWGAVEAIWAMGGEGAVIKRLASTYQEGMRSPDWLKVKAGGVAVGVITAFEAGKSGPHSAVTVVLENGVETSVKTLDNATLRDATAHPERYLGARLVISHKGALGSGKFRHPMWDHLAGPGE